MARPRLLDLFCGAGGAAVGYHRAGFDVVGVDNRPQPHYPFPFILADALEFCAQHGQEFDVIHASPPCQGYSITKSMHGSNGHPMLVEPTRNVLRSTGKPFVIENVPGAPLLDPIILCGTMFGLRVIRHRLFEMFGFVVVDIPQCNHWGKTLGNHARIKQRRCIQSFALADFITVCGHDYKLSDGRVAMGIDWMTQNGLSQAVPPAYTEFIGLQLRQFLDIMK